jgi:hypothetical protein
MWPGVVRNGLKSTVDERVDGRKVVAGLSESHGKRHHLPDGQHGLSSANGSRHHAADTDESSGVKGSQVQTLSSRQVVEGPLDSNRRWSAGLWRAGA